MPVAPQDTESGECIEDEYGGEDQPAFRFTR